MACKVVIVAPQASPVVSFFSISDPNVLKQSLTFFKSSKNNSQLLSRKMKVVHTQTESQFDRAFLEWPSQGRGATDITVNTASELHHNLCLLKPGASRRLTAVCVCVCRS